MEENDWVPIAAVMRRLAGDEQLAQAVVEAIRASVGEIAELELEDVVEHTVAFVTAGLEAVAERRAPTDAELGFVERLAATRAGQGVPISAMLAGLHVGVGVVWPRATELFVHEGVPVEVVGQVLIAHLAWTHTVQERAIEAHRRAELEAARGERDARIELLRTLLAGPVEPHHVAETIALGFKQPHHLWLLHAGAGEAGGWPAGVQLREPVLSARIKGELMAVLQERPAASEAVPAAVALVGPTAAASLPEAATLARRVLRAARRRGRMGLCTASDMAIEIVLGEEPRLSAELSDSWFSRLPRADPYARSLVHTLLVHLDHAERLEATAGALFVHPNTVRYRLTRLQELAGIESPRDMDGRARMWWAARAWLAQSAAAAAASQR